MKLLFISLLLFCSGALACPQSLQVFNALQVHQSPGSNTCFIGISALNTNNLVYRSYLFSNDGLMLVFNSFGNGPDSSFTGAREFYFFPRVQPIQYAYDPVSTKLAVLLPNNQQAIFNTLTGDLEAIIGAQIKIDPKVNRENKGGVEILNNRNTFLDLGFTLGQSPSQDMNRKVTFKGLKDCVVKNSDIFVTTPNSDVIFKYSDAQLNSFLNGRCGLGL